MFGNSLFNNDPFYAMHQQHMQQMNHMFVDPFGMGAGPMAAAPPLAIAGPDQGRNRDYERRGNRLQQRQDQLAMQDPFGGMMGLGGGGGGMFEHMNRMMGGMNSMMTNMHGQMGQAQLQGQAQANPNSHFYSSSTVMSYSNDGSGQPKVYQASKSTTQAPGGVREEKKTVKDSSTGVQKMSVARHMGDRAHVITKQKDLRSGDMEESHDYHNLDEDEADEFHQEFMSRGGHARSQHRAVGGQHHHSQGGRHRRDGEQPDHRRRPTPAIQYRDRD